ncbi:hypothetical protein GCM10010149_19900 [Nonomuraea roseoviolacea subsp. roseoviolacea]|uniref:serine hydrolase n=1 Tax=Nonomuraea roseoviolacea TaxID=103837 RepID=UPI0031D8C08B
MLAYMRAHPDDVALVTQGISHNADRLTAVASAIKIFHLAAYADAVRQGRAEPDERVSVALWNSYHLPGTDGGAHEAALRRLKPGTSVTLDQLVSAMIEDSDNAAADLLRDRLGRARCSSAPRAARCPASSVRPCTSSSQAANRARRSWHCGGCLRRPGSPVRVAMPTSGSSCEWRRIPPFSRRSAQR